MDVILKHHNNIIDVYRSKDDNVIIWDRVSEIINKYNSDFIKFYTETKAISHEDIKLDYSMEHSKVLSEIEKEKRDIYKRSLIILSLHNVVYDLMSRKGNYLHAIDGKSEMIVLDKNITYYLNISDKIEKNKYFHAFIIIYGLESLFNKHFYVGIDFEYTNKIIRMAQMNYEHRETPKSMIIFVNPTELDQDMMNNFIRLIMCNKSIRKILHGSDSLDIPYIYENMFQGDTVKIIKFTRGLLDTRFLCEYYKLSKSEPSDNKCSIYDAVKYFGQISDEQHKTLDDILNAMPPVNDIIWNIHKLSDSHIKYAYHDVIYLKYFYYQIISKAAGNVPDNMKHDIVFLYKNILTELTQFVYLERRGITFIMKTCEEEVNPINNYIVRGQDRSKNMKLIDVFKTIFSKIIVYKPYADIDKILTVNYFKALITVIIKKMTYTIISKKYRIYKDKFNVWDGRPDNKFVYEFLEKMEFYSLEKMFQEIEKVINMKIAALKL